MFRFTIREMLLVALCVGLSCAWWRDHQGKAEAAEDARQLAYHISMPMHCGEECIATRDTMAKYLDEPVVIVRARKVDDNYEVELESFAILDGRISD